MKNKIFTFLLVLVTLLSICALTATAATNTNYAIISNSAFEAEQGNLFSTTFSIKSDNSVEVVELHLAYDKSMAELSSSEIFTIGENISIKYNDKVYLVVSEIYEGKPEYYFFETLDGCTEADKKKLTFENYFTNEHYAQVFALEENSAANTAMISHIRSNYGMIVYDSDIRINATHDGVISVSWLPRDPHSVSGTDMFSLQFTIDENLAAADYEGWLSLHTGKRSFVDAPGGKELDLSVNISPVSIYEYGDINFDTYIDTRDALLARQHSLEIITLTGLKYKYADVNMDNVVNTTDALQIQQKTIGIKDHVGNRFNVYFHDVDGNICAVKSVAAGQTILSVPTVPSPKGFINGEWSISSEELIDFDFEKGIDRETHLYAFYEIRISELMQYYVDTLQMRYNSTYNRGVTLDSVLHYGGSSSTTEAEITWYYVDDDGTPTGVSKNEAGQYVLDQPGYNTELTLNAFIVSWKDGQLESQITVPVEIKLKGMFSTPTKSDIVKHLRDITKGDVSNSSITGGIVEYDVNLARKLTNRDIGASSSYEVRLEWYRVINGIYEPVTEINRTTSTQENQNFMCIVTFNGVPLEGDGKIYFDDVTLAPISEMEIRSHIISCISNSTSPTLTDGTELWNNDDTYGATVNWISKNSDIMTIASNVVSIKPDAISGISCPLTAQVTYETDQGANTFELSYNVSVITENSLLQPGINMDPSLYYALLDTLKVKQLTTEHLKKTEFVALDLSPYSEWFTNGAGEPCAPITDLTGLTYCENLYLLNISGLNITGGLNELCTLTRLETLIARDAKIETLKYGDKSALSGMIKLKIVDLSGNNITNLSDILDPDTTYTKLRELYLNDNSIENIDALSAAPLLSVLELSNNRITSLTPLSSNINLTKLSVANNRLTTLAGIETVDTLTELRAHNNQLTDCVPLAGLKNLSTLYLGGNDITDVSYLSNLTNMTILYLNGNSNLENVDALSSLLNLQVLQISDCAIRDLGTLYELRDMRELYAENNNIGSFMFIKQWQNLEKLLLANNADFDESLMLSEWLAPMRNLTTLTLSGKKLNDLSFLVTTDEEGNETAMSLTRLELANCQLPAFYLEDPSETNVGEYDDNISLLLTQIDTMRYLDISGNNLIMDSSEYTFVDGKPKTFDQLRMFSQLYALYANNLPMGDEAANLTGAMSRLTHLSMENCGITTLDCAANSANLTYIDLAGNPIESCDLVTFNKNMWKNIQYMYLDTTAENAKMINPGATISDYSKNGLLALSLEGYSIPSAAYLPQMNSIQYLDLSNTGISDLMGVDTYQLHTPAEQYTQSIFRFTDTLKVLDIDTDKIFTYENVNMLYDELHDSGVTVYLHADKSAPGFNPELDITRIVNNWTVVDRTISKSAFTYSDPYWTCNLSGLYKDFVNSDHIFFTLANSGTNGAFSSMSGSEIMVNDNLYNFENEGSVDLCVQFEVYRSNPDSLATSKPVTFYTQAGEKATVTVVHRYWSIADTKNGSFNQNSGSEVVTETHQSITGKTYTYESSTRSGFQASTASQTVDLTGDVTLVFDYPRRSYKLTLSPNGGTLPDGSDVMYLYYGELTSLFDSSRTTGSGTKGVKQAYMPRQTNYLFYSWYNGSTKISDEFAMPASDVTLTADWVYAIYTGTTGKKWTEATEDYLDWYDHAIKVDDGISDTDWTKLCEYGNTNVDIKIEFAVTEDDKGYQSLRVDAYNAKNVTKKIHEYKDYEAADTDIGSETFTEKKTANRDDVRNGYLVYMGCWGTGYDDYWGTVTITTTFSSKY